MNNLIRGKNFWIMIAVDIGLISLAYFCAYLLRFEGNIPQNHINLYVKTISIIIALKLSFFYYFNLYRGMWRYTGLSDFVKILQAVAISSTSLALLILLFFPNHEFSRSVLVLDFILTFIFVAGSRLSIRILFLNDVQSFRLFDRPVKTSKKKLLIIGAGDAGEFILREIKDNPKINFEPIGFLDDNRSKWGQSIHGVRVIGDVEHISKIKNKFDEILIAVPSATGAQMKQLVSMCEKVGKPFKTMPAVGELLDGRVSMKVVREVKLSDVIGRDEVHIDEQGIREFLLNKKVLVTGAGGSIGSELVRQISCFDPRSIALLDFSEYNLYQVEIDNRKRFKDINAYLVDLRNLHTTQRVFKEFKPDIVFHAAAYKHVPLQELNPWEALSNNLLGMKHVVECSIECGVNKFILVSSDKAVSPCNVMGATKRICELVSGSVNGRSSTKFIAVRFGNVIDSSGSVIPLFKQQIAQGGPLTVTHPEIARYFMSIPEAAKLILQAGALGVGGEIFILKMGNPIRIIDLARDFIKLHGLEPDKDIEIVFTGLRPGEKLYEELIAEDEGILPTQHEKIMVLRGNGFHHDIIVKQVAELIDVANSFDEDAIKKKIKEIVPEYSL